jgi:hypothetical protein
MISHIRENKKVMEGTLTKEEGSVLDLANQYAVSPKGTVVPETQISISTPDLKLKKVLPTWQIYNPCHSVFLKQV